MQLYFSLLPAELSVTLGRYTISNFTDACLGYKQLSYDPQKFTSTYSRLLRGLEPLDTEDSEEIAEEVIRVIAHYPQMFEQLTSRYPECLKCRYPASMPVSLRPHFAGLDPRDCGDDEFQYILFRDDTDTLATYYSDSRPNANDADLMAHMGAYKCLLWSIKFDGSKTGSYWLRAIPKTITWEQLEPILMEALRQNSRSYVQDLLIRCRAAVKWFLGIGAVYSHSVLHYLDMPEAVLQLLLGQGKLK